MVWLIVLLVILALIVIALIALYNRFVRYRNRVDNAWAQIEVQLKRRWDLIPNLVETVKGYAAHERGTLEAVIQARNAAVAAQGRGPDAQAGAENMLSGALRQLFDNPGTQVHAGAPWPIHHPIPYASLWIVLIIGICAPLASRMYQRSISS